MDELYAIHPSASSAAKPSTSTGTMAAMLPPPSEYHSSMIASSLDVDDVRVPIVFGSEELLYVASAISEAGPMRIRREDCGAVSEIKAKISSHPRYPSLLEAYIDCQKVGAPPDLARVLDEIQQEHKFSRRDGNNAVPLGSDPELDEFMETYLEMLVKCKSDLSRSFDEATTFLNKIQLEFSDLCSGVAGAAASDEAALSSDEECSGGEAETQELQAKGEDRDLKNQLLRRFGSHISSLKLEFSKKKKKGKLPRDARQALLDWWNLHDKWPYPTEADKISLAESTGLDQRQINNWFINQRKRHWKPPENFPFAVMNDYSGQYFVDD
ncbi:hypothetical protein Drorol1_Dr00008123 [Drosera rotundifolia]